MAMAEDAASVLEMFVQDVANLPAEIAHLLEEIAAKDRQVQDCRSQIAARDASIQKFIKANGCAQANPKDEIYCKNVTANFDRAQHVQEEKVGLSEKAALLLDRQIKRLDFKIRDLQNEGAIQPDPQLPSLLSNTSLSTRLPPLSTTSKGTSTPLNPLSTNAGPSTTIANNPITRLVQPPHPRQPSPLGSLPPAASIAAHNAASVRQNARSPSTDPGKRRRLNPHQMSMPAQSSSLRQSSLGPGTPKSGLDDGSRAGSAGPRPSKKSMPLNRSAFQQQQRLNHLNPASANTNNRKSSSRRRGNKKSSTPMSNENESEDAEGDVDVDMDIEEGEEEEGEGDDKKYCTCHSVSYGNMVACDNDSCPHEWFHWSCVGINSEPKGAWFCPECRTK